MIQTQTQKVAQRTNQGNITGLVYVLETIIDATLGKHYFFSTTDGEFGEAYSRVMYYRLPSKIRGLFA